VSDDAETNDIELPMSPVEGTDDQFTVDLPDGNRLMLEGTMPKDGDEGAFAVRNAAEHVCGRSGIVAKGYHVCDLCGGEVILCGNSAAPYEGRCCNKCNDSKVIPQRARLARVIEKLHNATRTPFDAIEARDALLGEFFTGTDERIPVEQMRAATNAEIIAWDADLQRAALRGADAFVGMPFDAKPCASILLLSDMAVILSIGETECYAVAFWTRGARKPLQIGSTHIRRGELLALRSDKWIDKNIPRGEINYNKGQFWIDIAALLGFMELEVVQRESARLPRQATRAAQRANKPLPKVMVVRLRRVYAERETGETEREWQHRWVVRLIYIAPFVKGPEGKPFLAPRDVVKVVSR